MGNDLPRAETVPEKGRGHAGAVALLLVLGAVPWLSMLAGGERPAYKDSLYFFPARRLHLAPRTVAYRLERIETLLGYELDGDATVRLSAALLALRVSRQAGRTEA